MNEKKPPIYYTITVTLLDVLYGAQKDIKIQYPGELNLNGVRQHVIKLITIFIPPGIEEGTQIVIKSGEYPHPSNDQYSSDLFFTVLEKTHSIFKRFGKNLECTIQLKNGESKNFQKTIEINTLDCQRVCLSINEFDIRRGWVCIPGYGLPDPNDTKMMGNLVVRLEVKPNSLEKFWKRFTSFF